MDLSATEPVFPPLLRGQMVVDGTDPLDAAIRAARAGTDPGLIVYDATDPVLKAAIVLAPESPLAGAMAMVLAASIGLADTIGALGPSETAVHFRWPGTILVNGARCGALRASASTSDPTEEPDWLVIALDIAFAGSDEPGANPDQTALYNEGCGDLTPVQLLESWSRHMLVWINRWLDDGIRPLRTDWTGRAVGIGEEITLDLSGEPHAGIFVGLDDLGGMLLRRGKKTTLLPLTLMLDETC